MLGGHRTASCHGACSGRSPIVRQGRCATGRSRAGFPSTCRLRPCGSFARSLPRVNSGTFNAHRGSAWSASRVTGQVTAAFGSMTRGVCASRGEVVALSTSSSWSVTDGRCPWNTHKFALVHPGEILHVAFLEPLGLSRNRVARGIGVPARRISEVVLGKRRGSADTALRLGRDFDTTPQFWLGVQAGFVVGVGSDEFGDRLDGDVRAPTAATQRPPPWLRGARGDDE